MRWHQLVTSQLPVGVLVEFLERRDRVLDFVRRDLAVRVGVQRREDGGAGSTNPPGNPPGPAFPLLRGGGSPGGWAGSWALRAVMATRLAKARKPNRYVRIIASLEQNECRHRNRSNSA